MTTELLKMVELTDTELDAVAAGHGSLVDVDIRDVEVEVEENNIAVNVLSINQQNTGDFG